MSITGMSLVDMPSDAAFACNPRVAAKRPGEAVA